MKFEICRHLDGYDLTVAVECEGFVDPGKTSGPPEDCYPPDSECEILGAEITECHPDIESADELLALAEKFVEKYEDDICSEFFERLAEQCDEEDRDEDVEPNVDHTGD